MPSGVPREPRVTRFDTDNIIFLIKSIITVTEVLIQVIKEIDLKADVGETKCLNKERD
jgi:hypothetical protein